MSGHREKTVIYEQGNMRGITPGDILSPGTQPSRDWSTEWAPEKPRPIASRKDISKGPCQLRSILGFRARMSVRTVGHSPAKDTIFQGPPKILVIKVDPVLMQCFPQIMQKNPMINNKISNTDWPQQDQGQGGERVKSCKCRLRF